MLDDQDLADVTLACEEQNQFQADKFVFKASRPVFKEILRNKTQKQLNHLNYWMRLRKLRLNSLQRRFERYKIIIVSKTLEGFVPERDVTLAPEGERKGRVCTIPLLKPKEIKDFSSVRANTF